MTSGGSHDEVAQDASAARVARSFPLCPEAPKAKASTKKSRSEVERNFPSSNTFDTLLVSFLKFTGLVGLASWHLVLTFFTTDFTHRHLQDLASAPRPSLRLPFLHSCGWPFWTQKCCFCWCLISVASMLLLFFFLLLLLLLIF